VTIGLDVGDKHSQVRVLDGVTGEVLEESRIRTTPAGVRNYFANKPAALVSLETGTHSPWISRQLGGAGHGVIVANARKVRLIHGDSRKSDRLGAEKLARLTRVDARLLSPIQHRSTRVQGDLARIRSRDALVSVRTAMINHVRGSVKAFGERLPSGGTAAFASKARERLPADLKPALEPVLAAIEAVTDKIKLMDKELAAMVADYPRTAVLRQVPGVGLVTALTFQLVIEDPGRFEQSREVGPYLGLTPGEHQSGERNPKRRITKEGDPLLRRLLVQCANHTLRSKTDTDLKRAALRIMSSGGHRSVAIIAIARKLAVLLHHLWVTGEVYEALHNHQPNPGSDAETTTAA